MYWHWTDWLPEAALTLVTGPSGVGKTALLALLAAHMTGPRPLLPCPDWGREFSAWLTIEDSPRLILRPRLAAAGADLARIHLPDYDHCGALRKRTSLPSGCPQLTDYLIRQRVSLLVIDPIDSFLDCGISTNDPIMVRSVLDALHRVASDASCAIVCTKHPRKGRAGSPLDWVSGSAAWTQAARQVMMLDRHPDRRDAYLVSVIKSTFGRRPLSREYTLQDKDGQPLFVLGAESACLPEEQAERGDLGEQEERSDALDWLRSQLAEPRETGALYRQWGSQGYSQRLWWRCRRKLGVTVRRVGPREGQQTFLELPPAVP